MDITDQAASWHHWRDLKVEIDRGYRYFWSQDQISGYDVHGKAIRTGVPRPDPTTPDWRDWAFDTAHGGGKVPRRKPKESGEYPFSGFGGV